MRLATVIGVMILFFVTSFIRGSEDVSGAVLVPLFVGSNCVKPPFTSTPGTLRGAYGTVWGTELWLRNSGDRAIAIETCAGLCDVGFLQPGQALRTNDGFCIPSLAGQGP